MRNISIIKAILPLAVIIMLFVFTLRFGLGQVTSIRSKVSTARKNYNVLTNKLKLLNQAGDAVDQVSFVSSALPEKNPALAAISQLKILASESGMLIGDVKTTVAAKDSSLSSVDVTFDVIGSRNSLINFLQSVELFVPISKVQKVRLTGVSSNDLEATITIKSYFAEFPSKLPTITEAINDLTAEEKDLVNEVLGLKQPTFVELQPSQDQGRIDPFNP